MDQIRPLTKKEIKALRRLEKLDKEKQEKSRNIVARIIFGVVAVLFIALFGSLIFLAKQNSSKRPPATLSNNGWVRGAENAKVTLIEFGDFQCPACKAFHPLVREVLDTYKDKSFRFVFKHFPLVQVHKNAFAAGMAAEAAGAQGKFFEMHDLLYDKQDEWATLPAVSAREKFISFAKDLKLDVQKFTQDLGNKEFEKKIRANQDEGIENGVFGTPTFFLNGKRIENPRSIDDFKKLIDLEFK